MSRLQEAFEDTIIEQLQDDFDYGNAMEVPQLDKIVVNMGVGGAKDDPDLLDDAVENLAAITGQQPVVTRAHRSVSSFKVREGQPVGCKVTLRGAYMYDFLDRLTNVALPRVRDFRGLSPDAFDGRGNYSLGLDEQLVFPEVSYDDINEVQGMDITIVTTAETDEEARALLWHLGMPFKGMRQAAG